jgi:D-psicose/D-tagatose/L-ribulose 3-epimerase
MGRIEPVTRRRFVALAGAALAAPAAFARFGRVEVGVCNPSKNFEKVRQYGYDYLEPSVSEIAAMSEADFQAFKQRVLATSVRCECFNGFIRTLKVVGGNIQQDALRHFVETSLDRCRQLGGSIVVWGSASSRNVPPGTSRAKAQRQIRDFLRMAGPIARQRGIVIAIEPLRKQESNILNTGAESLELVHQVNHPNIKMIIDYYHMRIEHESPEIVWRARKEIVHFHFANPAGRVWPKSPSEDPVYGQFFAMVKKIGFRGGISIEGRGNFEQDGAASLAFFKQELS